ncbi:hypothetical protein D9615_007216 [Tricholomella constricta]|uniref:SnoaL-like domain-containing protein n=1 Tax=Tricholomella constricta TaxID=117010 RepID=A0A8H5M197_9AGAR|nr:hypothetical protein D9615_007216 [Tricholomella constricta]
MVAVSSHLKLALAWITATNQMNLDQLASMIPDNFVSTIRPASLNVTPANKTEFLERLGGAPIKTFNISLPTTENIVETTDVIQFYTTADGHTSHGFPWKNEYIFTFTFTDNNLIQSVTEFTDPTVVTTAFGKEATLAEIQFNCTSA